MSFYNDVIRKSPHFTSTDVCKDMAMLEPGTRAATEAILAEGKAQGHDFRVLETFRSSARQQMLYRKGLTELFKVGVHNTGCAVDIAMFVNGKYVADGSKYGALWALAKKHGMISGEDWGHGTPAKGFRDPDHIQRVPVWRQSALFAGTWYPPEIYDPYKDQPAVA